MNGIARLIAILAPPIGIFNIIGGVGSAIWLAILGEWGSIGYGIGIGFGAMLAIGFILTPAMLLLDAPAAYYFDKGKQAPAHFFGFLSVLYTAAVIAIWCIAILYFYVQRANPQSIVPTLVWSYCIAIGPWASMAMKENGNLAIEWAATSTVLFAEVGYLAMIIMILLSRVTLGDVFTAFSLAMLLGMAINHKIVLEIQKAERIVRSSQD
ncbi:MAG: hypothetical protein D4R81_04985 [Nitrospiraceae bacterium]|nr:MAG: hypothetical protein D4R81_04985 [Nitrospiraceae bacterium]